MSTQTQISVAKSIVRVKKKTNSFTALLKLVSDESLLGCMNRLVAEEDYELAILYRDELLRRKAKEGIML